MGVATKPKWAVLVSGSGTILEAMIKAGLRADVVLADRPGTRAVDVVAQNANLPVIVVDREKKYGYKGLEAGWDREGFTKEVSEHLQRLGIEVVAMAGFDTVLSPIIFIGFKGRILNTHPSKLPAFAGMYGKKLIEATLVSGVIETGCTIHVATAEVDDPTYIVAQRGGIPVYPHDTVETLWERIKENERELYVEVIQAYLARRLILPTVV